MKWTDVMLDNYGTPPIQIVQASGTTVTDDEGNEYTDLLGGIAVTVLGHAHPAVTEAIRDQAGTLLHTSNLYAHPKGLELATRLRRRAPEHKAFLCNSGAEANEAALKLLRRHAHATDRPGGVVVAFENGFHGRTAGALALTGQPKYHEGFAPLPGQIVHVPYNDPEALQAAFDDHDVVGLFAECIQGEGGVVPMTRGMADTMGGLCRRHDAIMVVDEVQTGVGRTGRFFAFEHFGLRPDVITVAKGLGGGMPIGATLVHDRLASLLGPGSHGSTFGGNPVACAAAVAVLDTIDGEGLLEEAARKGRLVEGLLHGAGLEHRGIGLLIGINASGAAGDVVAAMRSKGVLVGQAGPDTVRLAPALNIDDGVLTAAVEAIVAAHTLTA